MSWIIDLFMGSSHAREAFVVAVYSMIEIHWKNFVTEIFITSTRADSFQKKHVRNKRGRP